MIMSALCELVESCPRDILIFLAEGGPEQPERPYPQLGDILDMLECFGKGWEVQRLLEMRNLHSCEWAEGVLPGMEGDRDPAEN